MKLKDSEQLKLHKMDINEIKKDLYKSKAMAKLMYYDPSNGDMMYSLEALGKTWTFPIHLVQPVTVIKEYREHGFGVVVEVDALKLTDDLKGARFEAEMRGSSLIRWIQQAIELNEFH